MAYATIGRFQKRTYHATNATSGAAAVVPIATRGQLESVLCAVKATQAQAGTWTVSLNGTAIISAVAVTTSAVGESSGVSTGLSTTNVYVKRGDVLSVVGSSLSISAWTFNIREY